MGVAVSEQWMEGYKEPPWDEESIARGTRRLCLLVTVAVAIDSPADGMSDLSHEIGRLGKNVAELPGVLDSELGAFKLIDEAEFAKYHDGGERGF